VSGSQLVEEIHLSSNWDVRRNVHITVFS